MAKKVDRRVRYTKMVLKDSLTDILAEKPIEKITVKEICEKADINRGTFYSHYSDQYDLYNCVVDEILEGVFGRLGDFMMLNDTELLSRATSVFEYLKENAETVTILIESGVSYSTEKRIRNVIKDIYLNKIDKNVDVDLVNATYSFIAAGAIALIRHWLNSDMKKSPAEMAQFGLKLTSTGLSSLL